MSYNLFIEHHEARQYRRGKSLSDSSRIGTGWEDDFTNALSFYFSCDPGALEGFCQLVLGPDYREPTAIETQYATPDGRPDVVISMASEDFLVIECKVAASLQPDQLDRCLEISSLSGVQPKVALFSKRSIAVPAHILENSRYKRPKNRDHFFWTDLYKILPAPGSDQFGLSSFRSAFRYYMELLGFSPTSLKDKWTKLYEDRTIAENRQVQREFGRKLASTRSWLQKQGFRVTAVSHKGLQAVPEAGPFVNSSVYFLVLGPERARRDLMAPEHAERVKPEILRMAVVYDTPEPPRHAWSLYHTFPTPLKDPNNNLWWPTKPYRMGNRRVRLEFVSNLDRFLDNETDIEEWIKTGCVTVLKKIYEDL